MALVESVQEVFAPGGMLARADARFVPREGRTQMAMAVAQTIINGVDRNTAQGHIFMPAFGNAYTDDEIAAVSNYVTARFGAKGADLTAKDIMSLRKQVAQQ